MTYETLPLWRIFNPLSVFGRFGRIFCPIFMARIQFPHKSSALTASFSVRQPPNAPFVLSCPPVAPRLPCGCRRRCKGFPSASSWPWPFGDRSALSVSRTSLPSQSPALRQVPSLCRPTAYSSSMAVSGLLSRRRISGSGCCRSAIPSVSGSSVPCTSSGTSDSPK